MRVREGGEVLQTIKLDRGCIACVLWGIGNNTLFLIATEWRGMENLPEVARARTGQVLTIGGARTRCRVAGAMIRSDLRTGSAHIADSSSTNAVNFSSARTTKRFPLSRCASAIQIVRPLESTVDRNQAGSRLLFLAEFLESGIATQRVPLLID